MERPRTSVTGAIALAAALFPSTTFPADTPSSAAPNPAATAPSDVEVKLPVVPTVDGAPIPERILKAAVAADLDLLSIKVEGGQWVGCKDGDVCIPLGAALPSEGGTSAPRSIKEERTPLLESYYTPEYLRELADLIRTRRDATILVVVSVPSSCHWCRVYAGDLNSLVKEYANREDVQLAVINFDAYEDATRVMGNIVDRFPFTAVFRPMRAEGQLAGRGDREIQEPFFSNIGHSYEIFSGRRTTAQLKRTIDPPLAPKVEQPRTLR